eukprot:SAG11_NODE_23371_length_390_cov_0.470790_2_plen_27_part_01
MIVSDGDCAQHNADCKNARFNFVSDGT